MTGTSLGHQQTRLERVGTAYSELGVEQRLAPPEVRRHRFLVTVGQHAGLIAVATIFLAPFFFVVMTALMTDQQAVTPSFIPNPFVWGNFAEVFRRIPFFTLHLEHDCRSRCCPRSGSSCRACPSRTRSHGCGGRGVRSRSCWCSRTLMLPVQVTIVPLYILWVRVGQIGHLTPLILPSFLGDAFSIFLLRQFFLTIPEELSDAARVDGASECQIMTRVIVPLAKPAIAAVALFNFLYNWNDLFSPLLFLGENQKLWTLTIGLTEFQQRHGTEWNLTMAASLMFMLPVIIMFFLAQRVFVEGVTLTGVKG